MREFKVGEAAPKFQIGDQVEIVRLLEDQEGGEVYLDEVGRVVAVDRQWEFPYEIELHNYELERQRKKDGLDLWSGVQLRLWEPDWMRLYKVTNGFTGYSEVFVLVLAPSEDIAIKLAREEYKKEAEDTSKYSSGTYTESYYNDLKAELLCDDVRRQWCGKLSE